MRISGTTAWTNNSTASGLVMRFPVHSKVSETVELLDQAVVPEISKRMMDYSAPALGPLCL